MICSSDYLHLGISLLVPQRTIHQPSLSHLWKTIKNYCSDKQGPKLQLPGNQLLPFLAILFSCHQDTQKVLSTIYHIAALPTLLEICSFDVKLTEGTRRSLTEFNWFYIMTRDQMYSLYYKEKFIDS